MSADPSASPHAAPADADWHETPAPQADGGAPIVDDGAPRKRGRPSTLSAEERLERKRARDRARRAGAARSPHVGAAPAPDGAPVETTAGAKPSKRKRTGGPARVAGLYVMACGKALDIGAGIVTRDLPENVRRPIRDTARFDDEESAKLYAAALDFATEHDLDLPPSLVLLFVTLGAVGNRLADVTTAAASARATAVN